MICEQTIIRVIYPLDPAYMRMYIRSMGDDDFEDDLAAYLNGEAYPDEDMNAKMDWVDDNPIFGSLHMRIHHNVAKHEVEEALFELPPKVEAKRHPHDPGKTIFWGETRRGRGLFISCEDFQKDGVRYLRPVTAFEPDEGYEYWRKQ